MMHVWDGPGWWWLLASVGILVVWTFVLFAVIVAVPRLQVRATAPQPDAPLTILERRYAQGDLTHDEFEERRRHLHGSPPGPAG